jgi:transcriptional regulator with XRE-family HTH domain
MDLERLFVLNLKKWRKNRALSQRALAERCGASHSYIRQIESGKGYPSFAFIRKLADALTIEPYLLFFDGTAAKSVQMIPQEHIKSLKKALLETVAHDIQITFDKLEQ